MTPLRDPLPRLADRELLAAAFRMAPTAMAVLEGTQHRIVMVNAAYRAMARGQREHVGRTVADVWPEGAPRMVPLLDRVLETGEACAATETPFEVVRDLGPETIWLSFSLVPMHDAEGRVAGVLATALDVSELVRGRRAAQELAAEREHLLEIERAARDTAEVRAATASVRWVGTAAELAERRRLEEELRDADRRKSEFLAVLSHELRNPLSPIRNAVVLLERAPPGSEAALRARAVIDRQSRHLARLVDDLLDVTRISRGKIEIRRERVDLREVVARTAEDHRAELEQRRIVMRLDLPSAPTWIEGDPTRLAQVVGNLLHNTAKFAPGGRVDVELEEQGDLARMAVRDDGAGIEPELLPRVFEPFVQAERSLARPQGGLGLGLSLVRGLVALHGGTVEARSAGPGRGAEIEIALPLAARERGHGRAG